MPGLPYNSVSGRFVSPASGRFVNPANPVNWQHDLNVGRVGWWKVVANPGWHGGATVHDLVRGGGHTPHDGTINGASLPPVGNNVKWSGFAPPGHVGSFLLDGSSGYISAPANTSAQPAGPGSIMAWIYLKTLIGHNVVLGWSSLAGIDRNGVTVWVSSTGVLRTEVCSASAATVTSSTSPALTVSTGIWTHVAVTWDTVSGINEYINGKLARNTANSVVPTNNVNASTIGRDPDASSNFFNGYHAGPTVYNRALTANEVEIDYILCQRGYPDVLNYQTPEQDIWAGASPPAATPQAGYEDSTNMMIEHYW